MRRLSAYSSMSMLLLSLCFASALQGAPPTLTSLYPAGGQQGKAVDITATGTFPSWPVKSWTDNPGIDFKSLKEKGRFHVSIAPNVLAGQYWVRFADVEGATGQRPFLVGSLPEVMEREPNDDPKKPQILTDVNVVVNGKLAAANDVDHFAISLKKRQTLVASLQANSRLRSPMDGLLQILSADGFVLAENNDFNGLDPQIVFPVPRDGQYIVRIFAFPATPDSAIRFFGSELCIYRLTLSTLGFADYAFPLAVSAKKPVPVELRGWNIPDSAKKVAVKAESVCLRLPVRHEGVINPAFVRVEPHDCITLIESNDRAHPRLIEAPVTISGRIDLPRRVNSFSIVLKKGEKRFIQVEARALGSPMDPVLAVYDAKGKLLDEVDDVKGSPDPELLLVAPADGTYRLEVRDRFEHGGGRYFYRMRIIVPEPDFALSTTADQFTVAAGGSVELPITIERQNGFAQAFDIGAIGLPAGVVCPKTTVNAADKSVKLKLTAGNDAVSGPFRVLGSAGPTRAVRAALGEFGAFTETFWLTVRPAKK